MPFPAARMTDLTQHGGVIMPPCAMKTMIEMLPAARVTDMHICPMVTVLVPHVGGPIIMGAPTVFIEFLPAARVTSQLVCVGPPDIIAMGAMKTIIGDGGGGGAAMSTMPAPPSPPSAPGGAAGASSAPTSPAAAAALASGQPGAALQNVTAAGHPVDVATGRMFTTAQDFVTPCALAFAFHRHYSTSGIAEEHGFGKGWTHPFAERIKVGPEQIVYHNWQGRAILFPAFPPEIDFIYHLDEKFTLRRVERGFTVEDPMGGVETLFAAVPGVPDLRPVSLRDAANHTLQVDYSGALPSRIVDALGNQWLFECRDGRHIEAIAFRALNTDAILPVLRCAYDAGGNLIMTQDALGQATRYQYDHFGRMVQEMGPTGYSFFFQYDSRNRCTRTWGQDGVSDLTLSYSDTEPRTLLRDAQGRTTTYEYNELGLVVRRVDAAGGAQSFQYHGTNQVVYTNCLGHATRFGHDPLGRVLSRQSPAGGLQRTEYLPNGSVVSMDARGAARQTRRSGPSLNLGAGAETPAQFSAVWDPRARRITLRDANDNASFLFFDTADRIVTYIAPSGSISRYEYDARGNRTAVIAASGVTMRFGYDALGRLTRIEREGGSVFRYEYDAEGRLSYYVDGNGRATHFLHDGANRLTQVTDPAGHVVRYVHDERSLLRRIVDARQAETLLDYDVVGRLQRVLYPDGRFDYLTYDPAGQLLRKIDRAGSAADREYDADGNLIAVRYPDGESLRFGYDPDGRLISARSSGGEVTFVYDEQGRMVEESQDGAVIGYEYDPMNRLVGIRTPTDEQVRFGYDAGGQLTRVVDWDGHEHRFEWTERNWLIRTHRLPNGMQERCAFTRFGQLAQSEILRPDSRPYATRSYRYDGDDRVTEVTDSALGRVVYRYDAAGRLERAEREDAGHTETFSHDPCGNRTASGGKAGYTYDNCDRLQSGPGVRCLHDATSNMVQVEQAGRSALRLTYDCRGLLVRADLADGTAVEYGYDAFSRRNYKRHGESETRYLWAGDQLLAEAASGPQEEMRWYTFLPGTFTPLSMRVDGEYYCFHTDHRGAPIRVSDAEGDFAWVADYAAYGEARIRHAEIEQRLRLPGQIHDAETDLHYNRARYYHAGLGRYLSPDPAGLAGGLNLFVYAGADPINRVDPLGRASQAAASGGPASSGQPFSSGNRGDADVQHDPAGGADALPANPTPMDASPPAPPPGGDPAGGSCPSNTGVQVLASQPQDVPVPATPAAFAPPPSIVDSGLGAAAPPAAWAPPTFSDLGKIQPCFPPGTRVLVPDGDRPIEELAVGDQVLTCDVETGEVVLAPITSAIRSRCDTLVLISVDQETVAATPTHPFWVENLGDWRAARALEPGMWLRSPEGDRVVIRAVEQAEIATETHNLEVGDAHTFFVGAGLLVHNGRLSSFAKKTRRLTRIYEVTDSRIGKVVYVGKTVQGQSGNVQKRFKQHMNRKGGWDGRFMRVRQAAEGEWTPFEAAVWEQHFIQKNEAVAPLSNKIRAITPEKYRQFSQGYGQSPCT